MSGEAGSASDDLEALANQLGLNRFHIVSTAAGGIVGLDFTSEHPERVISLIVSSSFTGVQDQSYLDVQHRLRASRGGTLVPGGQPRRRSQMAGNRGKQPPPDRAYGGTIAPQSHDLRPASHHGNTGPNAGWPSRPTLAPGHDAVGGRKNPQLPVRNYSRGRPRRILGTVRSLEPASVGVSWRE